MVLGVIYTELRCIESTVECSAVQRQHYSKLRTLILTIFTAAVKAVAEGTSKYIYSSYFLMVFAMKGEDRKPEFITFAFYILDIFVKYLDVTMQNCYAHIFK